MDYYFELEQQLINDDKIDKKHWLNKLDEDLKEIFEDLYSGDIDDFDKAHLIARKERLYVLKKQLLYEPIPAKTD